MENQVQNLGQAILVLKQAAEIGRKAGIYEWNDLDLISQSIKLINSLEQDQNAETPDETDSPESETKEVVLEPTKED